jgi:hypothetical protein
MSATTYQQPSAAPTEIVYPDRPEGPISAAIIAGGIGALALGIVTTLSEASTRVADVLEWSERVGPLSGKTIIAVVVWVAAWGVLHLVYRNRPIETRRALVIALILIGLGLIGTFPKFFQLFASE